MQVRACAASLSHALQVRHSLTLVAAGARTRRRHPRALQERRRAVPLAAVSTSKWINKPRRP
jgi:hypothetical protein